MKYFFFLLIFFFVVPCNADLQSKLSPQINHFIREFETKEKTLQGGAIAILHKDKVIYKKTFGNQKEKNGPITSETLFPMASVSKPVSAVALALLVEAGKINFQKKYPIPYLKNAVSLKEILSHTTGVYFAGNAQIEKGLTRQQLLAELKKQTPHCKPGQCYLYSNTTYSLIEEALNVEGMSLKSAIDHLQRVLKTQQIQILPLSTDLAIASPHRNQKALPFPKYYPKTVPAAAGVFASLDGLIDFYKLSFGYRPDLISPQTLAALYQPGSLNDDMEKWNIDWPFNIQTIDSFYGLGWRIVHHKHYPNQKLIFHSGMIEGVRAFIGFMPNEEYGIILLTNQNTPLMVESGMKFWDLLNKK